MPESTRRAMNRESTGLPHTKLSAVDLLLRGSSGWVQLLLDASVKSHNVFLGLFGLFKRPKRLEKTEKTKRHKCLLEAMSLSSKRPNVFSEDQKDIQKASLKDCKIMLSDYLE